jgi:hypothetical protein
VYCLIRYDTIRYDTYLEVPTQGWNHSPSLLGLREPSAVADLDKLKGLMQVHMHMPTPTPTLPHRTGSQGQTSISQPLSFTKSRSTVDLDAE